MARRSPWTNEKAELLVRLLDERYGLTITEDVAREDISDQVHRVATMMRVGRQAAKFYVTDESSPASPLISPPRLVRTTS
jgi:hypothetical protein